MHKRQKLKVVAIIPARLEASRFPKKLLQDLCGKSVIVRTYQATLETKLFDAVFVVTDSTLIFSEIEKVGGKAIMSLKEHASGSDRIAEAAQTIDADIIINVQGDEPFTAKEPLQKLIAVFENDTKNDIAVASLKTQLHHQKDIENPNNVKVVVNAQNEALYFSRAPIPYVRDKESTVKHFKHIGIYAFRKKALLRFTKLPMSALEKAEKLENLRFLDHNMKVVMVETTQQPIGIDTKEDLEAARNFLKKKM